MPVWICFVTEPNSIISLLIPHMQSWIAPLVLFKRAQAVADTDEGWCCGPSCCSVTAEKQPALWDHNLLLSLWDELHPCMMAFEGNFNWNHIFDSVSGKTLNLISLQINEMITLMRQVMILSEFERSFHLGPHWTETKMQKSFSKVKADIKVDNHHKEEEQDTGGAGSPCSDLLLVWTQTILSTLHWQLMASCYQVLPPQQITAKKH